MKTDKEVNFLMKLLFKLLTFLQKATIKQENVEFYYFLTKLHFKLYFGLNLIEEAAIDSREFEIAQHRHGCMMIGSNTFGDMATKKVYNLTTEVFQKNLLLEAEL